MADPSAAAAGDAAASAAAPPPTFVLDHLAHVNPLAGAVWRDRFFCAHFGDSHVSNTELMGHDQKKGGDMAALLKVLAFVARQTRDERQDELAQIGVGESQMTALDKAITTVENGSEAAAEEAAQQRQRADSLLIAVHGNAAHANVVAPH